MSIAETRKLLAKKTQLLAGLRAQRKALAGQMKQINRQIQQLTGGSKTPQKRLVAKPARKVARLAKRKPADGPSLKQLILEALTKSGKPMKTADVIEAVTQAGYSSVSGDFWRLVNTALREMKQVGRVAPGKYALKK